MQDPTRDIQICLLTDDEDGLLIPVLMGMAAGRLRAVVLLVEDSQVQSPVLEKICNLLNKWGVPHRQACPFPLHQQKAMEIAAGAAFDAACVTWPGCRLLLNADLGTRHQVLVLGRMLHNYCRFSRPGTEFSLMCRDETGGHLIDIHAGQQIPLLRPDPVMLELNALGLDLVAGQAFSLQAHDRRAPFRSWLMERMWHDNRLGQALFEGLSGMESREGRPRMTLVDKKLKRLLEQGGEHLMSAGLGAYDANSLLLRLVDSQALDWLRQGGWLSEALVRYLQEEGVSKIWCQPAWVALGPKKKARVLHADVLVKTAEGWVFWRCGGYRQGGDQRKSQREPLAFAARMLEDSRYAPGLEAGMLWFGYVSRQEAARISDMGIRLLTGKDLDQAKRLAPVVSPEIKDAVDS